MASSRRPRLDANSLRATESPPGSSRLDDSTLDMVHDYHGSLVMEYAGMKCGVSAVRFPGNLAIGGCLERGTNEQSHLLRVSFLDVANQRLGTYDGYG